MYRLEIIRQYYPQGTNGTMSYRGKEICKCIELPLDDNPSVLSCLPEGEYVVLIRETSELGLHLWIADIPFQHQLLVHYDNNCIPVFPGCIVPVESITGPGEGVNSFRAMENLMSALLPDLYESKPITIFITSKIPDHETQTDSKLGCNYITITSK